MLANAMKLGSVLDFNSEGDGKLRLKGTLVQSQSGEENYIGCFRGKYNSSYTYYQGDEVTYTVNNNTSTYRYINATPSRGIAPTNTVYWQIVAQGSKGESGADGTSVKIKGSLDSTSQLPTSGNEVGDGYLIDGNLHVWDGSKWNNVGVNQGRQGRPRQSGCTRRGCRLLRTALCKERQYDKSPEPVKDITQPERMDNDAALFECRAIPVDDDSQEIRRRQDARTAVVNTCQDNAIRRQGRCRRQKPCNGVSGRVRQHQDLLRQSVQARLRQAGRTRTTSPE